jgi:hypothetical protein
MLDEAMFTHQMLSCRLSGTPESMFPSVPLDAE